MNFSDAEAEIRKFFDTGWASATEVAYPDLEFTVPTNTTWVRFDVRENDGTQVSMGSVGNNRFRHFGIITIQVFQPSGQGSVDARDKANKALSVFMGKKTTNDIQFTDVQARQIGNDGKGFYQVNVLASFYYDELT